MKTLLLAATVVALANAISIPHSFALDGSVDSTFQSPQFAAPIPLITVEAGGTVLYAEAPDNIHFTLGRLTSTGAADASINIGDGPQSITAPIDIGSLHIPGTTNPATIDVIRPLSNGQILVGGSFSHFNKVARKLLVRLNADGSVDTSFNVGTGFEGNTISCIEIASDGKIYAGGKFTKFNGGSRNIGIDRLNSDGSLDSAFADGTISFGATVTGISLQSDGKVLIDAAYANASFQATRQTYRMGASGGLDATFSQGTGTPSVAAGLRHGLVNTGKILLSGGSGVYNGNTVNSALFRLNSDGTWDNAYSGVTLGLTGAASGLIGRFLPAPTGKIYFSGAFDTVSGNTLHGLARMNADGTLDTSFVPGAFVSPSPGALALQPDGKLLAGASTIVGLATKFIIVRLNGSGAAAPPPRIGTTTLSPGGAIQFQVSNAATVII